MYYKWREKRGFNSFYFYMRMEDFNVKAVVGANWGDEGKGKITDMLAQEATLSYFVFQGGANAGHTIVNKLRKICTHTTSVGCILQSHNQYYRKRCCIEHSYFNGRNQIHYGQECAHAKNLGFGQGADCDALPYSV